MKPTEAQRRRFWEWCGFTLGKSKNKDSVFYGWTTYIYPDNPIPVVNVPTLDLNNLWQYAVPKLDSKLVKPKLLTKWILEVIENNLDEKQSAQALFEAICEVIKDEQAR